MRSRLVTLRRGDGPGLRLSKPLVAARVLVMNTLLEGDCQMSYFTDLRSVFDAIGGRQTSFNWLITDLEYSWLNPPVDAQSPFSGPQPHWLSGQELTQIIAQYELQFGWAVLSGFPMGITLDPNHLVVEPYADGNPGFWEAHPQIQHPLSEIEIVCWDSTSTLILTRDSSISVSFRRYFPKAVDLDQYNQARLAP